VSYSPIGRHAVSLETFLFRRICANGLTHRWCTAERAISRTRRLPRDQAAAKATQFRQVRRLVVNIWQGLPQRLAEVAALRQEQLASVEAFLAQLLRPARLWSAPMRRYLHAALAAEDEQGTAYAALNAVTRVATHQPQLSARQRRALSALGGLIAHRHAHICPKRATATAAACGSWDSASTPTAPRLGAKSRSILTRPELSNVRARRWMTAAIS
jgi:hypothetical protein